MVARRAARRHSYRCNRQAGHRGGLRRRLRRSAERAAGSLRTRPGDAEPVRGFTAYTQKIADLLAVAPDLRLELVDSATAAGAVDGEELFFLHYVGHATGPDGPIEIRGLDRVRTRDGVVVENVIRYEPVFV